MKSKNRPERKAKKTVKNLGKGVFFLALLPLAGGMILMAADSAEVSLLIGGGITLFGIIFLVLSWFLFKRRSYPAAVILTLFAGLNLGLALFGLINRIIAGGILQSMSISALMSILFFWASYRGVKAAALIKQISAEKISPEIFS